MISTNSRRLLRLSWKTWTPWTTSSRCDSTCLGIDKYDSFASVDGGGLWTKTLSVTKPSHVTFPIPMYRVMNRSGQIVDDTRNKNTKEFDKNLIKSMYEHMTTLAEMDKILYESQRQGRISFYMTSYGEEAVQVGSAAALQDTDLIYAQYREPGALLWRGFTPEQAMNQCFANANDIGKGKQMPVHYGSKEHNYVTISSPLGTQLPQAVGSAYAIKLQPGNASCVLVYFGEGAASEGDAHAAFNFATTLKCPILFFCRNNGYAISTPSNEQYRGDGIAGRAAGYGMKAIRVDGNDAVAVYEATKLARACVMENGEPVLLEAMTYRRGHHSTSDDSSAYRSKEDTEKWQRYDDPIQRLRLFMEGMDWWNGGEEKEWRSATKKTLLASFTKAEKCRKAPWREMFNDVFYKMPENLKEQLQYMEQHVEKYKEHYPVQDFKSQF